MRATPFINADNANVVIKLDIFRGNDIRELIIRLKKESGNFYLSKDGWCDDKLTTVPIIRYRLHDDDICFIEIASEIAAALTGGDLITLKIVTIDNEIYDQNLIWPKDIGNYSSAQLEIYFQEQSAQQLPFLIANSNNNNAIANINTQFNNSDNDIIYDSNYKKITARKRYFFITLFIAMAIGAMIIFSAMLNVFVADFKSKKIPQLTAISDENKLEVIAPTIAPRQNYSYQLPIDGVHKTIAPRIAVYIPASDSSGNFDILNAIKRNYNYPIQLLRCFFNTKNIDVANSQRGVIYYQKLVMMDDDFRCQFIIADKASSVDFFIVNIDAQNNKSNNVLLD